MLFQGGYMPLGQTVTRDDEREETQLGMGTGAMAQWRDRVVINQRGSEILYRIRTPPDSGPSAAVALVGTSTPYKL
uniref:Lipocalin-like domain-containing protein n=1 Tax=Steinernema glaseri TaxID=37863 RepID=A0A1I7YZG8_9BILA